MRMPFVVLASKLETITFDQIRQGDVLKVTFDDDYFDYRHIHDLYFNKESNSLGSVVGVWYKAACGGGCAITPNLAQRLERVEPNTAYDFLCYHNPNWEKSGIPLNLDPTVMDAVIIREIIVKPEF